MAETPALARAATVLADNDATPAQIKAAAKTYRRHMEIQTARADALAAEFERRTKGAATKARQLLNYLEQSDGHGEAG